MGCVGWDLNAHPFPPPCLSIDQVAQGPIQLNLEQFQGVEATTSLGNIWWHGASPGGDLQLPWGQGQSASSVCAHWEALLARDKGMLPTGSPMLCKSDLQCSHVLILDNHWVLSGVICVICLEWICVCFSRGDLTLSDFYPNCKTLNRCRGPWLVLSLPVCPSMSSLMAL